MAEAKPLAGAGAGGRATKGAAGPGKAGRQVSALQSTDAEFGVQLLEKSMELPTCAQAARNLVVQSESGHLSTTMSSQHGRRAGYPFSSGVAFAVDDDGCPLLRFRPLYTHPRNLRFDPRVTLSVSAPGWSTNASRNVTVTFFGDLYELPQSLQEPAHRAFAHKLGKSSAGCQSASTYWRMHVIQDIYFVGGFGTLEWVDVGDYLRTRPDTIVQDSFREALECLNEDYADQVTKAVGADAVTVLSVDARGFDVRTRRGNVTKVERFAFASQVETLSDLRHMMDTLA